MRRHTLDLPEPESPIVTIFAMKLYGWVGWAMADGRIGALTELREHSSGSGAGDLEGDARIQFLGRKQVIGMAVNGSRYLATTAG